MEPPPLHVSDNNSVYSNGFPQPVMDNNSRNFHSSTLPFDNNFINVVNPPIIQHNNERSSPIFIRNEQQIIDNNINSHPNPNISSGNSQSNYTELFKIEISGVEILVRKKLEIQQPYQQNNGHPTSNLINRVGRIQNRMHPYQIPNKINNNKQPDIVVVPKQYYSYPRTPIDLTPQINQQGNISDIDQNYVNQ
ncbi:hypothetical protein RclHR1_03250003 [Rhizophagus clarus]|uniref:Uncharacterized protein n=1 Tax=Rhizophagus clarus TaxID=94130 RepID=A0A2Z6RN09_9GLOM|nr:hypothetical protein RclHR1_03250003 [Rhizophagus clarus]GES76880.1 hypothetical protein GLOIN_2v444501 [Rhizophagus clarus]